MHSRVDQEGDQTIKLKTRARLKGLDYETIKWFERQKNWFEKAEVKVSIRMKPKWMEDDKIILDGMLRNGNTAPALIIRYTKMERRLNERFNM